MKLKCAHLLNDLSSLGFCLKLQMLKLKTLCPWDPLRDTQVCLRLFELLLTTTEQTQLCNCFFVYNTAIFLHFKMKGGGKSKEYHFLKHYD